MGKAKTNKSFSKRLKVTPNGKILARKPGRSHFNAKESRVNQLKRRRAISFRMTRKEQEQFLHGI